MSTPVQPRDTMKQLREDITALRNDVAEVHERLGVREANERAQTVLDTSHDLDAQLEQTASMSRRLVADICERVAWTYLQAFFGLWIASGLGVQQLTDLSTYNRALVAVLPAVLSLLKGLFAAGLVGSPDTAATLPASDDTPNPEQ